MAAVVIVIADAVVTALNGASLSQTFTAKRAYVPIHPLPDLVNLTVSVVPRQLSGTLLDRATIYLRDYVIDIGIQKAIGQGAMTDEEINTASDPLMTLVQEIVDVGTSQPLTAFPQARCVGFENRPIYVPQHIDEKRVFTSVVSLTFRLGR